MKKGGGSFPHAAPDLTEVQNILVAYLRAVQDIVPLDLLKLQDQVKQLEAENRFLKHQLGKGNR